MKGVGGDAADTRFPSAGVCVLGTSRPVFARLVGAAALGRQPLSCGCNPMSAISGFGSRKNAEVEEVQVLKSLGELQSNAAAQHASLCGHRGAVHLLLALKRKLCAGARRPWPSWRTCRTHL